MSMIPKQNEADKVVCQYWLKAYEWSADQAIALLVGLNPLYLEKC